ncbi:MAG: nicotinamide-nucleotide amidohydrolase family protein [Clostridium sp.]
MDKINEIGKIIINKNITLACAESLTGGMLSSTIVSIPGVSSVFKEGIVAYSIEAKVNRLNIPSEIIDEYSDVSYQVASLMARNVAKISGARIGVSTTGNAGPTGNPVGLVYIGICIDDVVEVKKLNLSGSRQEIREETVIILLDRLLEKIKGID